MVNLLAITMLLTAAKDVASLAGQTLYQPRGKERVWSNPIHDLVSIAQRFGGGHAQNVTIRTSRLSNRFFRTVHLQSSPRV